MTLLDFLKIKEVREKFREVFPKPSFNIKKDISIYNRRGFMGFNIKTQGETCKLLAIDTGRYIYNPSFEECITFLFYRASIPWWRAFWNINFNISSILKLWDNKEEKNKLLQGEVVVYNKFKLNYFKDRTFKISKNRHTAKFFDLFNFYCCTLNEASTQYLNNKKIDTIDNQKSITDLPNWVNNSENIINYCIKESKLIKALGDQLVENIKNGKINVSKFLSKKDILAPLLTTNSSLVGIAFDYLLRFYLKYLNPQAITRRWVAETSLEELKEIVEMKKSNITENERLALPLWKDWQTKGTVEIKLAKERYTHFLETGQVTDDLIKSTLYLSNLEVIFRAGYIVDDIEFIDDEDVEDLRKLISLADLEFFKANKVCILNPTFGEGSKLVGGADADLVVDDMLIDIKTVKKLTFSREYLDQLIGYYTLYKIGGIDGMSNQNEIKKLGVYFSRYRYLYWYDIDDIFDNNRIPDFVEWFKTRAIEYGSSLLVE
ncbi:hypothetical protein LCGC14_1507190 [marine sediment metagenome]|uniref:Uncharacterized protein n=1 Tax=marine sediment metagenome TaxID=412755 RepID=A0A0F9LHV5_9ZZZZ